MKERKNKRKKKKERGETKRKNEHIKSGENK